MADRLYAGAVVVTPTGRRAMFDFYDLDGDAVIRYLDGDREYCTLRPSLLRVWQAGRAAPAPLRVAG